MFRSNFLSFSRTPINDLSSTKNVLFSSSIFSFFFSLLFFGSVVILFGRPEIWRWIALYAESQGLLRRSFSWTLFVRPSVPSVRRSIRPSVCPLSVPLRGGLIFLAPRPPNPPLEVWICCITLLCNTITVSFFNSHIKCKISCSVVLFLMILFSLLLKLRTLLTSSQ